MLYRAKSDSVQYNTVQSQEIEKQSWADVSGLRLLCLGHVFCVHFFCKSSNANAFSWTNEERQKSPQKDATAKDEKQKMWHGHQRCNVDEKFSRILKFKNIFVKTNFSAKPF